MQEKQKRYKVLQGLHVMKDNPKLRVLVLDISPKCNFNCRYCYGKEMSHKVRGCALKFDNYIDLLNQAKQFGVKTIWLMGAHENTLSPMYLELLKLIDQLSLFSVTFTNGAAFGDDQIARQTFGLSCEEFTRQVAEIQSTAVILKTDSFVTEVQNELAGNKNAFNQILQARENCLKHFSPSELPRFGLNTVLTNLNYMEVNRILEFSLQNDLVHFCDAVLQSGNARKNYLEVTTEQMQHCLSRMQIVLDKFAIDEKATLLVNCYEQKCILFDNYFFITHCGDVLPCAGFPERKAYLGNVLREPLAILWQKKLRLVKKYYGLKCKKCPCRVHLEDDLI